MNKFRLDKTVFKAQTVAEADESMRNYSNYSAKERLEIAYYLTSLAYGFDIDNPPRMDKTFFQMRSRKFKA